MLELDRTEEVLVETLVVSRFDMLTELELVLEVFMLEAEEEAVDDGFETLMLVLEELDGKEELLVLETGAVPNLYISSRFPAPQYS